MRPPSSFNHGGNGYGWRPPEKRVRSVQDQIAQDQLILDKHFVSTVPACRIIVILSVAAILTRVLLTASLIARYIDSSPLDADVIEFADHSSIALTVGIVIVFIWWLARSAENLVGLQAGEDGVDWLSTLGAFLVPFVNLVKPYKIASIVWGGSNPDLRDGWYLKVGVTAVRIWWFSWLAFAAIEIACRFIISQDNGPNAHVMVDIMSGVIELGAYIATWKLVTRLTSRQELRKVAIIERPRMPISTYDTVGRY